MLTLVALLKHFSCYSELYQVFDANKLIFKGFVKFQLFVFMKRPILVKMQDDGAFVIFHKFSSVPCSKPYWMKNYHNLDLTQEIWTF